MKKKKKTETSLQHSNISKTTIAYTTLPPQGKLSHEEAKRLSAYITKDGLSETDIPTEILLLKSKRDLFETNNEKSIYAIEAFITAQKGNLYPPKWALHYVTQVFSDWHKQQGTKTLDELFELNRLRGQRKEVSHYKMVEKAKRDFEICKNILALQCVFRINIRQACKMLSKPVGLAATTIEHLYKQGWGKTFKDKDWDCFRDVFSNYTVEKKIGLLKRISLDAKDYPKKTQNWLSQFEKAQLKKWGLR